MPGNKTHHGPLTLPACVCLSEEIMSSVFKEIQYVASVSPPTLSLTEKEILCPASLKSILTNVV